MWWKSRLKIKNQVTNGLSLRCHTAMRAFKKKRCLMLGIIGILLSLVLLIALAYRGVSVLILAPLMALLAVLFSPEAPLMASYTQVFMPALGGFVIAFFPLFLLGAIFGKLMDASGAALTIAKTIVSYIGHQQAIVSIVIACAVLTYGGVSLFVVAFAVYPIANALFQHAQVPKRLIPGTIALGAFTFTMTALPGTPAIQNAIPMPYFGTTPFAAPGLGLIGGVVMLAAGVLWLRYRHRMASRQGEGYGEHAGSQDEAMFAHHVSPTPLEFVKAIAPVVVVIVINYVASSWWFPSLDTSYLQDPQYGSTSIAAVKGLWAVIFALFIAIIVVTYLHYKQLSSLKSTLENGAIDSILPLLNTASQVGFGAVIASLAGFMVIRDMVLGMSPENPLISLAFAVNILAGITGSASGGMSIALQTLGGTWLDMGLTAGISPELLHRVTAIATGGLDSLPHNGAVITLLSICGLTHRQSYFDIFVVALLIPILALVTVIVLGSTLGSF
jgi:H+/gluconate symporter-like permease